MYAPLWPTIMGLRSAWRAWQPAVKFSYEHALDIGSRSFIVMS